MQSVNILSRADIEKIVEKVVERKMRFFEKSLSKIRQRLNELDIITCNFARGKNERKR